MEDVVLDAVVNLSHSASDWMLDLDQSAVMNSIIFTNDKSI